LLKLSFKLLYILGSGILFWNGSILVGIDASQDKLDGNQTAIELASAECLSSLAKTRIVIMAPLGIPVIPLH
jgi:hypothetical protein